MLYVWNKVHLIFIKGLLNEPKSCFILTFDHFFSLSIQMLTSFQSKLCDLIQLWMKKKGIGLEKKYVENDHNLSEGTRDFS